MRRLLVPSMSALVVLGFILIAGCQKQSIDVIRTTSEAAHLTTAEASTPSSTPTPEASESTNRQTPVNDFTIYKDSLFVSLHDWDNEVDLEMAFGELLSQKTIELGDGFSGSLMQKITYDGIELELFSPPQNREHFWIMSMMITKAGYATSAGIEVGSTTEQIKEAYPSIEIAKDGRTESEEFAYEVRDDQNNQNNYLHFEIESGVVSHIKIFHLIP